MSDRALTYVVDFSGTNGDSEVRKSTLWTPYWESIGSAFSRLGFVGVRPIAICFAHARQMASFQVVRGPEQVLKEKRRLLSLPIRTYPNLGHADFPPIRCIDLAAGHKYGASDGVHGS
jgi:hypothetical protein